MTTKLRAPARRPTHFDADMDAIQSTFGIGTPFAVYEAAEVIAARHGVNIANASVRASLALRYAALVALPDCPEAPQLARSPRFHNRGGRPVWRFVAPLTEVA